VISSDGASLTFFCIPPCAWPVAAVAVGEVQRHAAADVVLRGPSRHRGVENGESVLVMRRTHLHPVLSKWSMRIRAKRFTP
jgi:hypothetical protein